MLRLEWKPSGRMGVEAECGGYTLHVYDNPSIADLLAGRATMYEWRVFRHSWSAPVGARDSRDQRNTLPTMEAAQAAAEAEVARLLAEDAGLRAVLGEISWWMDRAAVAENMESHLRGRVATMEQWLETGLDSKGRPITESVRGGWLSRVAEMAAERDALRARVAEMEAAQRWIPVTERLPGNGAKVEWSVWRNAPGQAVVVGWLDGDTVEDGRVFVTRQGGGFYATYWRPLVGE